MTTEIQLLTIADWEAMPHGDGNRYEIIEGELFKSSWPGLTHQTVLTNFMYCIGIFLEDNPVGIVVHNPPLILSNYTAVLPDLVFCRNEQLETIVKDDRLNGPPAFIVEIVERDSENLRRDCEFKFRLYSKHEVPEYWIAYLKNMSIERWVNRGGSLIRLETLRYENNLTSEALPKFSCELSKIFRTF